MLLYSIDPDVSTRQGARSAIADFTSGPGALGLAKCAKAQREHGRGYKQALRRRRWGWGSEWRCLVCRSSSFTCLLVPGGDQKTEWIGLASVSTSCPRRFDDGPGPVDLSESPYRHLDLRVVSAGGELTRARRAFGELDHEVSTSCRLAFRLVESIQVQACGRQKTLGLQGGRSPS